MTHSTVYRPVTTLNMPIANPNTIATPMMIAALFTTMSISLAPSALRALRAPSPLRMITENGAEAQ